MALSKLCLGTAQFGSAYGITNKIGALSEEDILKSIQIAIDSKVFYIDTSNSYGNAENILGRLCPRKNIFKYITKITIEYDLSKDSNQQKKEWTKIILNSLNNLKAQNLEAVLLHRPQDLFHDRGDLLLEWLKELKHEKITNKIGLSIYDENDIRESHLKHLDIIQLPFSIYDNRKLSSGFLKNLFDHSIKIYARSVFLQGLVLADHNKWPNWVSARDLEIHADFCNRLNKAGISRLEAALSYVYNCKYIDKVVIGFSSSVELQKAILINRLNNNVMNNLKLTSCLSNGLLDPRSWPK